MMYGDGLLALLGVCAFSLFAARKLGLTPEEVTLREGAALAKLRKA